MQILHTASQDAARPVPEKRVDVPFLDLVAQNASVWPELEAALERVTKSAQFILGPAVDGFETQFAEYIGVRHCIGLNNGTSALHLALLAAGVGPGDEVITTPHSWISTAWAISYVGARPVFVDIDPVTFTLDPVGAQRAITPRTKVLLPVHLYGQAADLAALADLAKSRNLILIEDAAQAHGAVCEGQRVGSWGRLGCFSFYPGKNLGAFGEGGAVVTNDSELAERIRQLRDHAQRGRHNHVEIGFNMRMEGVQGAVLGVKLRYLDGWNAARARCASRYHELLSGLPGLVLPAAPRPEGHVWHLYVVLLRSHDREAFRKALAEKGVASGVHYPVPIPFQPAYQSLGHKRGDFPVAEDVMSHCVSLPMFAELTGDQIEWTAQAVRSCLS
jgi:dTDP-4-amino-4,6-dideoxygalactose transaminase